MREVGILSLATRAPRGGRDRWAWWSGRSAGPASLRAAAWRWAWRRRTGSRSPGRRRLGRLRRRGLRRLLGRRLGRGVGVGVSSSSVESELLPPNTLVERSLPPPTEWPKIASSDAVTTAAPMTAATQAGDDAELPREAAARLALRGPQAERVVLVTPPGYPFRPFAARADARGLLGAHRGARAGPARDARRGLGDDLGRAVQGLGDEGHDDRGDGGRQQRAALPEHGHHDRGGHGGEARDQERGELEAALVLLGFRAGTHPFDTSDRLTLHFRARARCRRDRRASAPRPCGRRRSRAPRAPAWRGRRAPCTARCPPRPAPRQMRTNGLFSSSSPTVVGSVWPGRIDGLRREREDHFHDRVLDVLERGAAGRADAADGALEQRVAGEQLLVVDEQVEHAGGVAGRVQDLDRSGRRSSARRPGACRRSCPGRARPGARGRSRRGSARACHPARRRGRRGGG